MVPAPERDPQDKEVCHQGFDINRTDLLIALQHLATYICNQNADITIIAVGGVVNTVHLRTREMTHDVDFLGGNEQIHLLRDASIYAQQQSKIQLGANWLNNATILIIPLSLQNQLIREAILQDVVLFRERGLTVLAAPWNYAFCGKTNRMDGPGTDKRPYDCQDAVAYLHEYILINGKKPVELRVVQEWGKTYERTVNINTLKLINDMYRQTYGEDGLRLV
jgi:hypothetical protein